jgi:hypothetical protein
VRRIVGNASADLGFEISPRSEDRTTRSFMDARPFLGCEDDGEGAEGSAGRENGIPYPPDACTMLMQNVAAGEFKGTRVRLSAQLRVQDADGASIWLRANDAHGNVFTVDNRFGHSDNGAVSGIEEWVRRHVVLDISQEAQTLHYGFVLGGGGRLWGRDMKLDAGGQDVALTTAPKVVLAPPSNFDFAA